MGVELLIIVAVIIVLGSILLKFLIKTASDSNECYNIDEKNNSEYQNEDCEENSETSNSNYDVMQNPYRESAAWSWWFGLDICQENTVFSICKNYSSNWQQIFEYYFPTPKHQENISIFSIVESNYKQYGLIKGGETIEKYINPIEIKIAQIHKTIFDAFEILENGITDTERYENDELYKYFCDNVIQKSTQIGYVRLEKEIDELNFEELFDLNINYSYPSICSENDESYIKITGIALMNGNNTTEDMWIKSARAKKIKLTIESEDEDLPYEYFFELKDTMEIQLLDFKHVHEKNVKIINIQIDILEKYDGQENDDVYISDIRFGIDNSLYMM